MLLIIIYSKFWFPRLVLQLFCENDVQQNIIQAALVIRGFGIRGFDYSRMQKPRIKRENCFLSLN